MNVLTLNFIMDCITTGLDGLELVMARPDPRQQAALFHNATSPQNTLLGLPQELRDHIFSYLLPQKIHLDVSLYDRRKNPSDDSRVGLIMKACAQRAACINLRKVSKTTRNDVQLLLESHIEKVTLVIDVATNSTVHETLPLKAGGRIGQSYLRKIKHIEMKNCYGVSHGRFGMDEGEVVMEKSLRPLPYSSLARLSVAFDRIVHDDGLPAVRLTQLSWDEFVMEEQARLSPRDLASVKITIESILAFRLKHIIPQWTKLQARSNTYEMPHEATITPLLLWKLQKSMAFYVHTCYRADANATTGTTHTLEDFEYALGFKTQKMLEATRTAEPDAYWEASGEARAKLVEMVIPNHVPGKLLDKEVSVAMNV